MAILINGNGNPAIYAAQDADLIASLAGNTTGIAKVGNECAYSAQDANTISVADGVIVTKEGRRIQLDAGENDTFIIPAGTVGVTNYYIIGYQLHENASGQQVADTFVQLMANATETIQEDTFRGGASDVYVSLYRVEQDGVNLGTITLLLPKLTNISQINSDVTYLDNNFRVKSGQITATNGFTINTVRFKPTAIGFDLVLDVTAPTITSSNWIKVADITNPYTYTTDAYRHEMEADSNNNVLRVDWSIINNTINVFVTPAFSGCHLYLMTYVGRAN